MHEADYTRLDHYEATTTDPTKGYTLMVRNPKMEKLKDRLSPTQQFSRRERMKNKGTFRQESEKTLAQHAGGINAAFKGIEMIYKKHRVTRYSQYVVGAAVVIDYIGRYLGKW